MSITVDLSQGVGNEHPTVEMVTGEAGARGPVVDLPSSADDDEDVAPKRRRMPKRQRKNVDPNRAKYPLAKYPY